MLFRSEAMLTKEQNERLTRVGPGQPMGELLRRYWHPIAAACEFNRLKKLGGSRVHDYPCFVMLDNQMPDDVRRIIVALRKERLWDAILVEASGGIVETNAELYAEAEVDVISIGALTHSSRALDLSQRFV